MVPLFTIKDGRLGIWDATFDEYYFSHREYEDYIESNLKSHPAIKEEVEKDLSARKKDIDEALEVKAKKDKLGITTIMDFPLCTLRLILTLANSYDSISLDSYYKHNGSIL